MIKIIKVVVRSSADRINDTETYAADLDQALRKFKKMVINDGILQECRKREYYLSKSQRRKLKDKEAAKRLRKKFKKV